MSETVELLDNRVIFDLYQKSQLPSNILFQKQSIFKDSSTNFDKIPIPIIFDHEKEAHECSLYCMGSLIFQVEVFCKSC